MKTPARTGLTALLTAACLAAQEPAEPSWEAVRDAAIAGNNDFALELYARLREEPGNVFFAPLSVRTALAMTAAGARGRTLEQMRAVLHLPDHDGHAHRALGELARRIATDDAEGGSVLHAANALWAQRGEHFLPAFLELCEQRYGAHLSTVDFVRALPAARATINGWVGEQTSGRIPELLAEDDLDASTVLVLTNAIDFEGSWLTRFDEGGTAQRPFFRSLAEDDRIEVPTMSVRAELRGYEDDEIQLLEMPYAGGRLSMVVLLPRARDGLTRLEEGLSPARLATWLSSAETKERIVRLPRFETRAAFHLEHTLPGLGMTDAFSLGIADFSGMNGRRDLYVGAVIHEAFVRVDEQGTVASGATAVVMKRGGPPIPTFVADHPFVYLIRDVQTGAILFLGRLVDPTPR